MSGELDWLDYVQKLGPAMGAVASTAAAVIALVVAFRGAKKVRSEQAEQITAWFTGAEMRVRGVGDGKEYVDVEINNASNQVVYDLIAQVVVGRPPFHGVARPGAKHLNAEYGSRLGAIPPGRRTVSLRYPGAGMHKRLGIELAFQDAAGKFWFRAAQGTLKPIKESPADFYGLDHPVSWG
jgi:hypothetical protein